MTTINDLAHNYGRIAYGGKTLVLVHDAYIDGPVDAPIYTACAIDPDTADADGLYSVYEITWEPLQAWLDGDRDDEGDACDWDNPADVVSTGAGYILNEARIV